MIVEERSRNVSLINCFTRKLVDEFPTPMQRFVLYAVFANGMGTIPVEVRVTRLHGDEDISTHTVGVTFADPLVDYRFVYRFQTLVFPEPGKYEFALYSGSELLAVTCAVVAIPGGPT